VTSDADEDGRARIEDLALELAVDVDAVEQSGLRAQQIPQLRAAAAELRWHVRSLSAQLGEDDRILQYTRSVIAEVQRICDEAGSRAVGEPPAGKPDATPGEHYAAAIRNWRAARRRDELRAGVEAASAGRAWRLAGSYLEACNCEVICPCRQVAGRPVGRPTYGVCEGALSWAINHGHVSDVKLSGLAVVLAFRYDTAELGSPWDFALYLDDRANDRQQAILEAVFTGRLGGPPMIQFPWAFKASYQLATRVVPITVDHLARPGWFHAGGYVSVKVGEAVSPAGPVRSLIPGHDRDGTEHYGDRLRVVDGRLAFEHQRRCAYQGTFDYIERHAA
jgi:hypothetical protein